MVGVVAGSGFAVMLLPAKQRLLPLLSPNLSARITLVGTRLKAGVAVVAAPGPLSVSIALTLSAWAMTAVVFAAAAAAVGFEVTPAQVLLIAAATNLATAIPSAPGYVGTFEFAVVATAGAIGLDAASALAMGILVHATILATTTVGGFAAFYVVTNGGRVAFSRPRRPAR
jgi:hypothetical protein